MVKYYNALILTLLLTLLAGCSSVEQNTSRPAPPASSLPTQTASQPAEYYLSLASQAMPPQTQAYQLQAAARYIQEQRLPEAQQLLVGMPDQELAHSLRDEKHLLAAQLALAQNNNDLALQSLQRISDATRLPVTQKMTYYSLTAQIQARLGNPLLSAEARIALSPLLTNAEQQRQNNQAIWSELNQVSAQDLSRYAQNSPYGLNQGWLEFVYIAKQYAGDASSLQTERALWQQRYPRHPANSLLRNGQTIQPEAPRDGLGSFFFGKNKAESSHQAPKTALLVPLSGPLSSSGRAIKSGYTAALYDNRAHSGDLANSLQAYDTNGANISALYRKAINEGATLVIGPLEKSQVAVLEKIGDLPVPTLALNYTQSGAATTQNLYQFALSPQDEARQVAEKAWQDGHRRAIVIAPAESWGAGIAQTFQQSWKTLGGSIIGDLAYSDQTRLDHRIKQLLAVVESDPKAREKVAPTRRTDVDVIFLVATPTMARQIKPLLKFYYADTIPVYATAQIYSGQENPLNDRDLDGIRFCDIPWVLNDSSKIRQAKQQMSTLLPNAGPQQSKLFAFGYDAYTLGARLISPPHSGIPGMTGTLYFNNHQIFRQLEWAQFQNGTVRSIGGLSR